jgi:hypothetical protein
VVSIWMFDWITTVKKSKKNIFFLFFFFSFSTKIDKLILFLKLKY